MNPSPYEGFQFYLFENGFVTRPGLFEEGISEGGDLFYRDPFNENLFVYK